ncbi:MULTISPECIES: hypothetical protein [Pantoea]|uniref:Uncharacterized protein n=1 Tax=Candidatus Pantoea multigeneris TaxID=2608357 RepID=A0ABX0R679_9GAMM|nr:MULTISPECIES: hypothetical protein [Pantoea]NIF20895.1 hypothetical protein [Pantoea multigeneris]
MTGQFVTLLAAFMLLAVIIIVLIRTTRLRIWQGVVLFILPLLLANLLWFSWLAPRQQQQAMLLQARMQLAQTPGYRVLEQQEPMLWQMLVKEMVHRLQKGESAEQAMGELRGWLTDVMNQRMAKADDATVHHYVSVAVQEMQALQQKDPLLCFRFLYPQVSGGVNLEQVLSPQLNQLDQQTTEQLLLNSTGNEVAIDQTQAHKDLQQVVTQLYSRWGDKLQQLNMPADTAVNRAGMCSMSIDLYSKILALPDKRAANLLRTMVSLSG